MNEILALSSYSDRRVDEYLYFMRQLHIEKIAQPGGWGAAFVSEDAVKSFHEFSSLRSSSAFACLLASKPETRIFLGGVSRNRPETEEIGEASVHPHIREYGGRNWTFLQAGDLSQLDDINPSRYRPVGRSSGELVFCRLMDGLASAIQQHGGYKKMTPEMLASAIEGELSVLNRVGEMNFVLSDGHLLFVHSHSILYQKTDASGVAFSSRPAGQEGWETLLPNTLLVVRDGEVISSMSTQVSAPGSAWDRIAWEEANGTLHLKWDNVFPQPSHGEFDPNCG